MSDEPKDDPQQAAVQTTDQPKVPDVLPVLPLRDIVIFPFMIVPLYVSLEKLDPSLLEAAADLGADARRTFTRVILPQTLPGIAAGCVLVFIPSLGAYLAPDLLGGGKTAYVGNLIQSQFAVARDMPFGAALSFVLSLLVAGLLLLFRRPLAKAQAL